MQLITPCYLHFYWYFFKFLVDFFFKSLWNFYSREKFEYIAMCSLLPVGHLEVEWKIRILCSFFAAVGGIQISKSLHLNLNATRSQDWLWCLLDMWASKTSWIKVPTMGRLCLRNFFCSSDLKIFLLAKCSLTPPVGEHWRSLNNTRTAIALHWERFYPSHLKKVNCSSEIHSTSSSQN